MDVGVDVNLFVVKALNGECLRSSEVCRHVAATMQDEAEVTSGRPALESKIECFVSGEG